MSPSQRMPKVDEAWHKVRLELQEVGLLYNAGEEGDGYLDQIELVVSPLPSFGSAGFIYDVGVNRIQKLVGIEEGVIYLPADTPQVGYMPGYTLADVIRHEYAHAWYWLEPKFVDAAWFREAFGGSYLGKQRPIDAWRESSGEDLDGAPATWDREFRKEFVSEYAATRLCEDFAETFMYFLRYRRSLKRFKNRPGGVSKADVNRVDRAAGSLRTGNLTKLQINTKEFNANRNRSCDCSRGTDVPRRGILPRSGGNVSALSG